MPPNDGLAVLFRYKRETAGVGAFVGTVASTTLMWVAIFAAGDSSLFLRLSAIALAILLLWMSLKVAVQLVLHGGAAVWIAGERLYTVHWNVKVSDIEDVVFIPNKRVGFSFGPVLEFCLSERRRRHVSVTPLVGDGGGLAALARDAIRSARPEG